MFIDIPDADFVATVEALDHGVILFEKKLCPHCKNMLKALEKIERILPGVPIYTVNSERCQVAMEAAGVERVPTVCVIKDGKIAAQKTGLMNPREILEFYQCA